jgi:hypothetical protein
MAKQTEQKETSQGICRFCQGEFAKNKMTAHLKSCKARLSTAQASEGKAQRLFHLFVEGKYRPQYWMHLEIPAAATLDDLDDFMRAIWLECCGHLSEFEIGDVSYSSVEEDEWGMNFGGLHLVGDEEVGEDGTEDGEDEEDEEDEEMPSMQEMAAEISRQLSAEFQTDLKDVPLAQIEQKLEQLFAANLPPGLSDVTMPALRPLLGSMAISLQQGTLEQDLEDAELEEEDEGEGGMDTELGEVLSVGDKFSYTYDFGSSSTLSLRVIAEREGVLPDDEEDEDEEDEEELAGLEVVDDEDEMAIVIMARNEPPALVCHICGQPATRVPSASEYDVLGEVALCDVHAREYEDPDELLPIANSPRTGICAYTGDEDEDSELEEWDEDEEDDEDE